MFLGQAVDDAIAKLIVAQLLHLESQDPEKDISLYVNSPGGVVYAGLAIYGQTVARVHDDMDRDRYMTAEQAQEYGLIDGVISSHELSRVARAGFARG